MWWERGGESCGYGGLKVFEEQWLGDYCISKQAQAGDIVISPANGFVSVFIPSVSRTPCYFEDLYRESSYLNHVHVSFEF